MKTTAYRGRLNVKHGSDGSILSSGHDQVDLPRDFVQMRESSGWSEVLLFLLFASLALWKLEFVFSLDFFGCKFIVLTSG